MTPARRPTSRAARRAATITRLLPLGAGMLFAAGLGLSGMTQPAKVRGFLDFFGAWDPSLAFVMVGAVAVYLIASRSAQPKLAQPRFSDRFHLPPAAPVDGRLLTGAAIFGVGWGLSGFCPGPALVSLGGGIGAALWFVPAMLLGMAVFHRLFPAPPASDG